MVDLTRRTSTTASCNGANDASSTTAKRVLVTGGAGYIGSHTVLELLQQGYEVSVIDNLSNASEESLRRVQGLTGCKVTFYYGDIQDSHLLDRIFSEHPIWAVIHFAALKSAPDSVSNPLDYYQVNIFGSLTLLRAIQKHNVRRLVFSSTAAVYGTPKAGVDLIPECHDTNPANPYGRSKLTTEYLIQDFCNAEENIGAVLLRYFNPVGAHKSGLIGEAPKGQPGNLMPLVVQVAMGQRSHVEVTGMDWPTEDGTGVRDFIHVVDLAKGHVAALGHAHVLSSEGGGCEIFNMGRGKGISVMSMIETVQKVSKRAVPWKQAGRRPGDVAQVVANPAKAKIKMKWSALESVQTMCRDAWNWTLRNPHGYDTAADIGKQRQR
ncbi:hypothetical protein HDU85_003898 [Gaertneriomyces sp. JEL0708]|nr:hypothetical protein HDU85_003898 [Gaertneriomyces sp. JEL0708]